MTEKKHTVEVESVKESEKKGESSKKSTENKPISSDLKTQIILTHALSLIIGFIAPLIFLLISEDKLLKSHSKESLNWQLTYIVYSLGGLILTIVSLGILGFIVGPVLSILWFVFPIMAAVKASEKPDEVWKYPATIQFFKSDK